MIVLSLPTVVLVAMTIVASMLFSIAFYYIVHPFWSSELTEDTKKTADLVATRTGIVYALVIGMMFLNARVEHTQMIEAIENEASALTRLYRAMQRQDDEESLEVRAKLLKYIRFIVDEQWPALREARLQPGDRAFVGGDQLDDIWNYISKIERKTGNSDLSNLLDQVEHNLMLRLFDSKGSLLPLFWYIAGFGYLTTLISLYINPPTFRRCTLVSIYSSMVALALLGVFIMTHPYSTAAGIEPDVFKTLIKASAQ